MRVYKEKNKPDRPFSVFFCKLGLCNFYLLCILTIDLAICFIYDLHAAIAGGTKILLSVIEFGVGKKEVTGGLTFVFMVYVRTYRYT